MNLSFYFSGINTKSVTEYGIFSFIRNCRTFFQSDCTIYIRTTKVWSSSSASFPAWYCHYFLILSILVDMLGCVIVGLICIFPMSSKVKHLFMRLFPSLSSSAKCLFMSLGLFFFLFFLLLNFQCSLYILDTSPLLDMHFEDTKKLEDYSHTKDAQNHY